MSEEVQTPEQPAQAVQTPEQPESKSFFNEDGGWNRDAFGELGKHSIFDKYKTPDELVKATINKDHVIGKKTEEWWNSDDPDIVARRNELMGVPKSADEYVFNLPENAPVSQERINAFKEFAKELGVPKEMAAKLVEWDADFSSRMIESAQKGEDEQLQQAESALKEKWKNKYEYNVSKVADVLDHLGLGEFKDNPAYGNNPAFIQAFFDKIVPLVESDEIIEARQTQSLATMQDRLSVVEDKIFEYPKDKLGDHEYKKLLEERQSLYSKIA